MEKKAEQKPVGYYFIADQQGEGCIETRKNT